MAPERYVLALLVTTQRWAPPALVLAGVIVWIWMTPPINLATVQIVLVVLFALAAWLGHATATSEEPGQELISVSNLGSATRLLLAKWTAAVVLSAVFPLLLVAGTFVVGKVRASSEPPPFTDPQALAAALAMVLVAAAGAALGSLVATLLPGRPGWAAGVLILLGLAQAAPWMAPVSPLSASLPAAQDPPWVDFLIACSLAVLLAGALLAAARLLRHPVH